MTARGVALALLGGVSLGGFGVACRAIAGIDSDLVYGLPDAGRLDGHVGAEAGTPDGTRKPDGNKPDVVESDAHEAGTGSCPMPTPIPICTYISGSLGPLFINDAYVYAELVTPGSAFSDTPPLYYNGVLACPKTGGEGGVVTIGQDASALAWGGATAAGEELYFSVGVADAGGPDAPTAGYIQREAADGSAPEPVASGLSYPLFVATNDSGIFWVNDPQTYTYASQNVSDAGWQLLACPLSGCSGTPPRLVMAGAQAETIALAVDSTHAYVLATNVAGTSANIYECSLDGGCGTALNSVVPNVNLPLGETTDPLGGTNPFAGDGTYLYMADVNSGDISRIVPSTHASVTLATHPSCLSSQSGGCPLNLAVDSTYVYWTLDNGMIERVAKDGTGPTTPTALLCGLSGLAGLAVDSTSLYFTIADPNNTEGTLVARSPLP